MQVIVLSYAVAILIGATFYFRKMKKGLFYLVPILNILFDILVRTFGEGNLFFGTLRIFILLLVYIFSFSKNNESNSTIKILYWFLIYLFLLTLFSSAIIHSIIIYAKFAFPLLMFPVAIKEIRDLKDLKVFFVSIIMAMTIITFNFFLAQIFQFGPTPYLEEGIHLGALDIQSSYFLAYGILLSFFVLKYEKNNLTKVIIYRIALFLSFVALVLLFRRSPILGVIGGIFIQLSISKHRAKILSVILIGIVLGVALFPFFEDVFYKMLDARTERSITEERRYIEGILVLDDLSKSSPNNWLFGKELFNSQDYFRRTYRFDRQLHTDFFTLLHGSGVIGIAAYLFLIYKIFSSILSVQRRKINLIKQTKSNNYATYYKVDNSFHQEVFSLIISFLFAFGIISLSGQYYTISGFSLIFIIMGGVTSIVQKNYET